MTIRNSTSQTIVSVLNTVSGAATAVTKVVDSVSSSVDMMDAYVQRAKNNQIIAHKVEDYHWRKNLLLDSAKEQEKKETAINKEYAGDQARAQRFNSIYAELEALFIPAQP